MIGYVTLGTNDLPRAAIFYDAIAAEMGVGLLRRLFPRSGRQQAQRLLHDGPASRLTVRARWGKSQRHDGTE